MVRKSDKSAGRAVTISESIDEISAAEFMAEVSPPAEPQARAELNSLLDKVSPFPTATTDTILNKILGTEVDNIQPKKRGRKPKQSSSSNSDFALDALARETTLLPVPEPTPIDVDEEKAKVLSKINLNVMNFEPILRDVLRPSKEEFLKVLPKKGLGELRTILKMLEHTRSVNNTANQLKGMVLMGASGIEMVTSQFGLKTAGYAAMVKSQEEEIQCILREIAMERVDDLKKFQRPEVRLALLMTTTLMAVDSRGRLNELRQYSEAVPTTMEQTYSSL